MARRTTLLVPGLARLVRAADDMAGLPGLVRFSNGAGRRDVPDDRRALLWSLLGGGGTAPAVAPVTRLADTGRRDARFWLRSDPVGLLAGVADAGLVEDVSLTRDEAGRLAETITGYLADTDYRLETPGVRRWYLCCPAALEAKTVSPRRAAATGAAASLPAGPGGAELCSLMTEIQMLLHDHAVNREREARGEAPVNALWLWGGGHLPEHPPASAPMVFADDPYARGLALLAGGEPRDVPDSAAALAGVDADALVLLAGAEQTGVEARACLESLDRAWVAPLVARMDAGGPALDIVDAGVGATPGPAGGWLARLRDFTIRRGRRWPWPS